MYTTTQCRHTAPHCKHTASALQQNTTHCKILSHAAIHLQLVRHSLVLPSLPTTLQAHCNTQQPTANILQHTANTLHIIATHLQFARRCRTYPFLSATLKHTATHYKHTATHRKHTATFCNILQHSATFCNTPAVRETLSRSSISVYNAQTHCKHTATHCQHIATFCNIMQHTCSSRDVVAFFHLCLQNWWNPLQSTTTHCKHRATHRKHTATICNTLQHTCSLRDFVAFCLLCLRLCNMMCQIFMYDLFCLDVTHHVTQYNLFFFGCLQKQNSSYCVKKRSYCVTSCITCTTSPFWRLCNVMRHVENMTHYFFLETCLCDMMCHIFMNDTFLVETYIHVCIHEYVAHIHVRSISFGDIGRNSWRMVRQLCVQSCVIVLYTQCQKSPTFSQKSPTFRPRSSILSKDPIHTALYGVYKGRL